ncbi:SDR family NAD(P)-dependent oxidoreductase [Parafrankia sp. BMG5.11]|uniref:SDR family NAD(P)-dependent oxidoreductase n=1 Tax=Parafrankia sp. BMG5.11 TaxID=222540 RepID=UPI001FB2CFEA|nr:SDR family oxidoreductase [Parafrankia sp. BMG5.11]
MKDKAILVIGAATGIGAATVGRLASEGARVCAADVNFDGVQALAERLSQNGGNVSSVPIDIAIESTVAEAVARAVELLGELDGAYLNAADLRTIFADSNALDVDLAVFDRTLAVNLRGHLLCTRAVLPHLLANDGGAIVYTSSSAAHGADPERPSYAVSKSGLNALMRHVASRWGREGITSNCISPGFVMTPEMVASGQVPEGLIDGFLAATPSTRVGHVDDVAAMAALLLSDDGRWINGQVINVNGGGLIA